MKICNRNDLPARKVLKVIKRLAREAGEHGIGEDMIFVESYDNGREHGFALSSWEGCKLAFAENRNSDHIVVYTGKSGDFDHNSNIPSEKSFDERTYFDYNETDKAARFIFNTLKSD